MITSDQNIVLKYPNSSDSSNLGLDSFSSKSLFRILAISAVSAFAPTSISANLPTNSRNAISARASLSLRNQLKTDALRRGFISDEFTKKNNLNSSNFSIRKDDPNACGYSSANSYCGPPPPPPLPPSTSSSTYYATSSALTSQAQSSSSFTTSIPKITPTLTPSSTKLQSPSLSYDDLRPSSTSKQLSSTNLIIPTTSVKELTQPPSYFSESLMPSSPSSQVLSSMTSPQLSQAYLSTSLAYDQLRPSSTQPYFSTTSLANFQNVSNSSNQANPDSSSFPWLYFGIGIGGSLALGIAGGVFCRIKCRNSSTVIDPHLIQSIENRLDKLEQRLEILDNEILTFADSIKILNDHIEEIKNKIHNLQINSTTSNDSNQNLLTQLLRDQERAEEYKKHINEFKQNPDLDDYYHNLVTQLSAVFIASLALKSNQLSFRSSEKYSKKIKLLSSLCKTIPVIGEIASQIIEYSGSIGNSYQNAIDQTNFSRITDICESPDKFYNIAQIIGIKLTIANKNKITALQQAKITTNWKNFLRTAISKDTEEAFLQYLNRNNSQASILGINQANQIILHLISPDVAKNLRTINSQSSGSQLKEHELIIAEKIIADVDKFNKKLISQTHQSTTSSITFARANQVKSDNNIFVGHA